MATVVDKPIRRKRRWFQFSLAAMLLLTTACGAAARVAMLPIWRLRAEAALAERIHASGGETYTCGGLEVVPEWMCRYYKPAHNRSISHIRLPKRAGDAELGQLGAATDLMHVWGFGHEVTDAGLAHLGKFPRLTALDLSWTKVTDAGIAGLMSLGQLKELNLSHTKVTDAGLAGLSALKNLKRLNLDYTAISDAGLKELADCKGLEELELKETAVSDDGVAKLNEALPGCLILRI